MAQLEHQAVVPDLPEDDLHWCKIRLSPFVILFNLCPPLGKLIRGQKHVRADVHGWYAEYRHGVRTCHYCDSAVLRFEYGGEPVPMPQRPDERRMFGVILSTPAGVFMTSPSGWVRGHWEQPPHVMAGEFSAEDRERGWYPTVAITAGPSRTRGPKSPDSWHGCPVRRKNGTPDDWCLIQSLAPPRWVDPHRMGALISV